MSLSVDKQSPTGDDDFAAGSPPAASLQPTPAPVATVDAGALQSSVGNAALVSAATNGADPISSDARQAQSTFGNSAVARARTAQSRAGGQAAEPYIETSVPPSPSPTLARATGAEARPSAPVNPAQGPAREPAPLPGSLAPTEGVSTNEPGPTPPGDSAAEAPSPDEAQQGGPQQTTMTMAASGAGPEALAEEPSDAELDLSDADATVRLTDEWQAEPLPSLEAEPIASAFSAPLSITLTLPSKPAPAGGAEASRQTADAESNAAREAGVAYQELARIALEHHEAVLACGNSQQRELAERAKQTIDGVEASLLPRVDELRATLDLNQLAIDNAGRDAEMAIESRAAGARRLIGGAATSARSRIARAAAGAEGQLPAIGSRIRRRFETTYSTGSTEIGNSGRWAYDELSSNAKKRAIADAIPAGNDPEQDAGVEAKRRAVPAQLDRMAGALKTRADAQAQATINRFTTAPAGGMSIAANIDAFIESLRTQISGGSSAGGQATQSLAQRGNHAVDGAHSQALRSLPGQVTAAREAVRALQTGAKRQLAMQHSAALSRLSGMRRSALQDMHAQAKNGLSTIANATRSALPLYGDSAERVEATLRNTALAGAAALSKTARTALAPVARSLEEGRRLQMTRLTQIAAGAGKGVASQTDALANGVDSAAGEFPGVMDEITAGSTVDIQNAASQQGQSFETVALSVSAAADSFTQPMATMFAAAIADQVQRLDPVYQSEEAAVSGDVARTTGDHQTKVNQALAAITPALEAAAATVDGVLNARANSARNAINRLDLDENALMAAFRGLSPIQATAVEFKYNRSYPNLRAYIEEQHDATLSGLNDNEYNSINSALNGDPGAAARYELASTTHWYGDDTERAIQVVESLSDEQRRSLTSSAEWASLASELRSGMHGSDLNIFNALDEGNRAQADAIRLKDRVDAARRSDDTQALLRAVTEMGASQTPSDRAALNPDEVVQSDAEHREAVQREFAVLPGVLDHAPETTLSQAQAADALATYATRTFTTTEAVGEGGTEEVTHQLDAPARVLVGAIAKGGTDSVDARAARILYESERPGDDKPDQAALEAAVVDPRLNPALTPDLTPQERAAARAEQDQIFARYAELARENGVAGAANNAREARQLAAERLQLRYGDGERDRLGAAYVASIVLDDRPDPVLAMRYAVLGLGGTDEDLIHRTLGRLSRDEVDELRFDYRATYGATLDADLAQDLSGDDLLKARRELMGVPRNERERAEVALFAMQQQFDERGFLDVNAGSREERALFDAQQRLQARTGGEIVPDQYGRPTIVGGSFDERGRYSGADRDAFARDLNLSSSATEAYVARIDRIESFVTTGITILGAVVGAALTVATGGAAGPLVIAALATGLATMVAKAAIRGGRYGWEEAAVDLGMTAVQALTAGVGAQLGAASQVAINEAKLAGATAAQITRMGIISAARIGATTGAMSGIGSAALNERTWERGIGSGLGLVLQGGLRGGLSGAVTGAVTSSIEGIGRGENTLGNAMQGMSAPGRGLVRSGISGIGGMAGRTSELLFDTATGQFHGNRYEALSSIGEAGSRSAFQGFFEGAAESAGQLYHDNRHPSKGAESGEPTRRIPGEPTAHVLEEPGPTAHVSAPDEPGPATHVLAPDEQGPTARVSAPDEPGPTTHVLAPDQQGPTTRVSAPDEPDLAGGARRFPALEEPEAVTAHPIIAVGETELPGRITRPDAELETAPGPESRRPTPSEHEELSATRPQPAESGTAAAIPGSEFHGANRAQPNPEAVQAAISRALPEIASHLQGLHEGNTVVVEVPPGRLIKVNVEIHPPSGDPPPVASFRSDGNSEYTIHLSSQAADRHIPRALAHEIAEIKFLEQHGPGSRRDALAAGSKATGLSAHDVGRLAEVEVIARQIEAATLAGHAEEVTRLHAEAAELMDHLGLVHGGPASDRRRALIGAHVGADSPIARAVEQFVDRARQTAFSLPDTLAPGDPRAIAQTRSRFGDEPNYQDWAEFKFNYEMNAQRGNLTEAELFRDWAEGRYISEHGRARGLLAEELAPSPGFEANLTDVDTHGLSLDPSATGQLVQQREAARAKQGELRTQMKQALDTGDTTTALALKRQFDALVPAINDPTRDLGEAAGRAFAKSINAGTEIPLPHTGANMPDLIFEGSNGRLTVIEAKGGGSELRTREGVGQAAGRRVQQGTRAYLESLAAELSRQLTPRNPVRESLGLRISEALANGQLDYFVVRQPLTDTGQILPVQVGKFEIGSTANSATTTQVLPSSTPHP